MRQHLIALLLDRSQARYLGMRPGLRARLLSVVLSRVWSRQHGPLRGLPVLPRPIISTNDGGLLLAPAMVHAPAVQERFTLTDSDRAIRWVRYRDALVRPGSGGVEAGGAFYMHAQVSDELGRGMSFTKRGLILAKGRHCLVVDRDDDVTIDRGILIDGRSGGAVYHFLLEVLPRALFLHELPIDGADWPLLVPRSVVETPTLFDALRCIAPDSPVIGLDDTLQYRVRELVTIDSGARWDDRGVWVHPEMHRRFRSITLDALGISPVVEPGTRFFIRRPANPRPRNEEVLCEIATELGLVVVRPEQLSWREQVALWASAELMVGGSGAAWSLVHFSPPDTSGLYFWDARYGPPDLWRVIASGGGRTLTDVQFGRTADEADLDTGRFRGALITLLDGLQRL